MLNFTKYFVAIVCIAACLSESAHADASPAIQLSYHDAGCSDAAANSYNDFCHAKLRKGAVQHCLSKGYSGQIEEIEDSYDFDGADGDRCSTTSGRYISFACISYYRCL